jgi:hypothetical protein
MQSMELMLCSGCRKKYYCSPQCLRLHWKAGHKAECRAQQAQAQEKAAVAEEGAGPSTSGSKNKTKKKKEKK